MTTPASNVIDWTLGLPGNGWLGAHQRATQFGQESVGAAGPIEMGVRVYLPKVGRFLQVDPVDGGSASAYDYVRQDPANDLDLTGLQGNPCSPAARALNSDVNSRKRACKVWRQAVRDGGIDQGLAAMGVACIGAAVPGAAVWLFVPCTTFAIIGAKRAFRKR